MPHKAKGHSGNVSQEMFLRSQRYSSAGSGESAARLMEIQLLNHSVASAGKQAKTKIGQSIAVAKATDKVSTARLERLV